MMGGKWKKAFNRVPGEIRVFLVKGLLAFIAWQLLYNLVLRPARIPDQALNDVTAVVTARVISIFHTDTHTWLKGAKVLILIDGKKALGITDPCNGLEIYVLYIAFLFCYPGNNKKRFLYTAIGVPVIFVANIIRCCLLTWLNLKHRGWFDISHHYIFTSAMYLLVFYLWQLYSKKKESHAA